MRDLKISFLWALVACFLSLGTALTPWFTLSARVALPEISRHDECIFEGPDWKCVPRRGTSPADDPGALSWQEIPAHYFFNHHLSEEKPLWNPYIGSGYPIFLDGITRATAPSRMFLSHFPTDGARDFLIFFRILLFAWGILFVLTQLGASGPFLLAVGVASTMLPFVARFVDIIFLDVDLLAPWIFALFLPFLQGKKVSVWVWTAILALGLWVGSQAFIQSQIIFCVVLGFFALLLVKPSRGRVIGALIGFAGAFFITSLPYVLEFKKFFPELASNRPYLGCTSSHGTGLGNLWYYGYVGYLKNSELGTVFTILGIPFCIWGAVRFRPLRYLLGIFAIIFVWMAFGTPEIVCQIDGLNGIHVSRHLDPYAQSLFLILVAAALYLLTRETKHRKILLTLGFFACIYPGLNHNLISFRHLAGIYSKAVEFHPERIGESSVYSQVQKLSQREDRRHFAPDWRMYPNYSAIFEILDMRVLYGVFPKRVFSLNDSLFHEWHEEPGYGHADRFVGPDIKAGMIPPDLEKLLVLHRVSLLTFSKNHNWIEKGQIYNPQTCQLRGQDEVAAFYFCPVVQGVGFFPKEVAMSSGIDQSLEILKRKPTSELIDFAVIEDSSGRSAQASQGKVISFERHPNRLVYNLEVERAGYFVVADSYFAGWSAKVNGREAEILPANVGFKAVGVSQGTVKLEMDYNGKLRR